MKKKVKIYNTEIKRSVRRGLMENLVEQWEMKDTYSRAGYKQSPKEKEIGGVFGQYEEDIPPAVLRYMRKNPKAIIKRLYDVYGQQMFDYISEFISPDEDSPIDLDSASDEEVLSTFQQMGDEDEIEIVDETLMGEEEDLKVYNKSDVSKVLDDDSFKGVFGYKEADDNVKMVTVNEIKKLYENKSGKGCADTPKGCVRKRGNKWIILNNKKGGVWKEGGEYDTKEAANEKLKAIHA